MRFSSLPALKLHIKNNRPSWARGITIHHTGIPNLGQRPNGFSPQHITNLKSFYKGLGWSGMPHFFVDDQEGPGVVSMAPDQPLSRRGIHAVSFNRSHIGIEMLGNYDVESATVGRGAKILKATQALCAAICLEMGWNPETAINFHRDDPKTSKTCPGRNVDKRAFIAGVVKLMKSPMKRSEWTVFTPSGEFEHVVDREGRPTVPIRLFAQFLGSRLPIGLVGKRVIVGLNTVKLSWRDEGGSAWVDAYDAAVALGFSPLSSGNTISVRAPK
jgi:N-acetylmuramoyl-L-alanine amidase CwlA